METTDWRKCYGESWQGVIVPDAFAHPAKFSRALIRRIYDHATAEGWLVPGDVVVDPFGGVALGALHAMRHGLHWVGVELEQPFVDMASGCNCTGITKEDWVRFQGRYGRGRYLDGRHWCPQCMREASIVIESQPQQTLFDLRPHASYVRNSGKIPTTDPHHYTGNIEVWENLPGTAQLLHGDSRELAQVVQGAGCCVSSPPYATKQMGGGGDSERIEGRGRVLDGMKDGYGSAPGQLAALPEGDLSACISSPPFADSGVGGTDNVVGKNRQCVSRNRPPEVEKAGNLRGLTYGDSGGQLGAMPEGQLAAGVVSSPPYEKQVSGGGLAKEPERITGINPIKATPGQRNMGYQNQGTAKGQLGQESGATFWSASRVIVDQVYQVLKPGGVAIWVTKSFVRKGERVDFPGQWRQLCEAAGFETLHEHRAWLVEERGAQWTLDGELERRTVKRVSFFRRLAEQRGSPSIDWETVLCMRKA